MAIKFESVKTDKPQKAAEEAATARPKPKGRPLAKDMHLTNEATKPWEAEGMSRRTWYRRQKEAKQ